MTQSKSSAGWPASSWCSSSSGAAWLMAHSIQRSCRQLLHQNAASITSLAPSAAASMALSQTGGKREYSGWRCQEECCRQLLHQNAASIKLLAPSAAASMALDYDEAKGSECKWQKESCRQVNHQNAAHITPLAPSAASFRKSCNEKSQLRSCHVKLHCSRPYAPGLCFEEGTKNLF